MAHQTLLQSKQQAQKDATQFTNDLISLLDSTKDDPLPEDQRKIEYQKQEHARLKTSLAIYNTSTNPLVIPDREDWETDFHALENILQTRKEDRDETKWLVSEEAKEQTKALHSLLGKFNIPKLSNCLEFYPWHNAVIQLQTQLSGKDVNMRMPHLRNTIIESITMPGIKSRLTHMTTPAAIIKTVIKIVGTPEAFTIEATAQLAARPAPSPKTIAGNLNTGLHIFRAFHEGPIGLARMDDMLITLIQDKCLSRRSREKWDDQWTHSRSAHLMGKTANLTLHDKMMQTIAKEKEEDFFNLDLLACFKSDSETTSALYKRQLLYTFLETEADNEAASLASLTMEEASKSKRETLHFSSDTADIYATHQSYNKPPLTQRSGFRQKDHNLAKEGQTRAMRTAPARDCPLQCGSKHPWACVRACILFTKLPNPE